MRGGGAAAARGPPAPFRRFRRRRAPGKSTPPRLAEALRDVRALHPRGALRAAASSGSTGSRQPRDGDLPRAGGRRPGRVGRAANAASAAAGLVTQDQFYHARHVIGATGGHADPDDEFAATTTRLYAALDLDGSAPDYREVAAGVAILCAGSDDHKLGVVFDAFDTDENGVLSHAEGASSSWPSSRSSLR